MRGFLVLSDENSKYKRAHGPIWLKLQMHECFLTPESWSLVHRERISSVESGKVPVSCHRNHGLFKPDFLDYQMRIMISISPRVFLKSNIGTSLVVQWLRLYFYCRGRRFDWETKIPHAAQQKKKKKSKVKENILKDIQMQAVSFLSKVETLLPSHFCSSLLLHFSRLPQCSMKRNVESICPRWQLWHWRSVSGL